MEIPPYAVCECGRYSYREFSELEATVERLQAEIERLRAALIEIDTGLDCTYNNDEICPEVCHEIGLVVKAALS